MSTASGPSRRIRRIRAASTLAAAAALAIAVAPAGALGTTTSVITYVSDTSWDVRAYNTNLSIGNAQEVCLNETHPSNCPAGATVYGWVGSGWGANDESSFSEGFASARWIWAPEITGDTTPADGDRYTFRKAFTLPWEPTSASIRLAVDDEARVMISNARVGDNSLVDTSGSFVSGNASPTTIDLTGLLVAGENVISIDARNGVICGQACTYAANPAGLLAGITIVHVSGGPTVPPTSTLDGIPAAPAPASWLPVVILAAGVLAAAAFAVPSRRRR
jgi:hypothetical protein